MYVFIVKWNSFVNTFTHDPLCAIHIHRKMMAQNFTSREGEIFRKNISWKRAEQPFGLFKRKFLSIRFYVKSKITKNSTEWYKNPKISTLWVWKFTQFTFTLCENLANVTWNQLTQWSSKLRPFFHLCEFTKLTKRQENPWNQTLQNTNH